MKRYTFSIYISYQELLRYYQGEARTLVVTSDQGLRLAIGVDKFRSHVSVAGLSGYFELETDDNNKFISLTRLY